MILFAAMTTSPVQSDPEAAQQSSMLDRQLEFMELTFRIHLIAMSGPRRIPRVRILWVATTSIPAVYEGMGSWSKCVSWMKRLPHIEVSRNEWIQVREAFERNQYTTLHGVRASLHDLESLGLQRVDS